MRRTAAIVPAFRRWATIGLLGAILPALRGAQIVPLTVDELALQSDCVFRGRVEALEVSRGASGHVNTCATFSDPVCWRGTNAPGALQLLLPGGILGERFSRVAGQRPLRLGDDVVIFAKKNPTGALVLADPFQACFLVSTNQTGAAVAEMASTASPTAGAVRRPGEVTPIESLRRRVEEAR
jgi:hypothetical protein